MRLITGQKKASLKRPPSQPLAFAVAVSILFWLAPSVNAQIINGNFSAGLTGWTASGLYGYATANASPPSATVASFPPGAETLSQAFSAYSGVLTFDVLSEQAGASGGSFSASVSGVGGTSINLSPPATPSHYAIFLPASNYTIQFSAQAFGGPGDFTANASLTVANVALLPLLTTTLLHNGTWVFNNLTGQGQWFDPPTASSYVYSTDGASKFTQVGLPLGLGDLDGKYTVTDATNGAVTIRAGTTYTFPTPVTSFTVSGIDPAVDGGNSSAFPTYLKFDHAVVNFTMTPMPPAVNGNLLPGDFNRDNHVTSADIQAMLGALADLNAYKTQRGLSDADLTAIGDVNGDGKLNNADLQALLTLLKSGGGSLAAVPEPTSMELAGIGAMAFLAVALVRAKCSAGIFARSTAAQLPKLPNSQS